MKARVRALGEKISSEDAVARAVETFHRYTKTVYKCHSERSRSVSERDSEESPKYY
jgi:hypothetical protein